LGPTADTDKAGRRAVVAARNSYGVVFSDIARVRPGAALGSDTVTGDIINKEIYFWTILTNQLNKPG
jgi:hypothetical protein